MNRNLIIIASLLGMLSGVILGYAIFFGFPQLSNFNVEEYIAIGVLLNAGFWSFIAYRRAASRKFLHAAIVFVAVPVLTVVIFVLLVLFFLFVICGIWECKLFPFL